MWAYFKANVLQNNPQALQELKQNTETLKEIAQQ
jgi:hypothetical protein